VWYHRWQGRLRQPRAGGDAVAANESAEDPSFRKAASEKISDQANSIMADGHLSNLSLHKPMAGTGTVS
jgi:hypothetical protein